MCFTVIGVGRKSAWGSQKCGGAFFVRVGDDNTVVKSSQVLRRFTCSTYSVRISSEITEVFVSLYALVTSSETPIDFFIFIGIVGAWFAKNNKFRLSVELSCDHERSIWFAEIAVAVKSAGAAGNVFELAVAYSEAPTALTA